MTMDINKALKTYGLNDNEIKVFLALVELGGGYAKDIVEKTKFHKNIVYDNLYKLIDKGLVSEVLHENKKYFSCEGVDVISEFIESTQKKFKQYSKDIDHLKKEISRHKVVPVKTQVKMFTGVEGVRQLFRHELEIEENYYVIGAPKESVELLGDMFWKGFVTKQKAKKMKGKIIFNESLRKFSPSVEREINEIKFHESNFEPLTQINIYGNFVSTIVWSKEPIGTLIENEEVAKSYKQYFNILWKQSKK
jgi:sugar-specific transcriptional regulator TrmB